MNFLDIRMTSEAIQRTEPCGRNVTDSIAALMGAPEGGAGWIGSAVDLACRLSHGTRPGVWPTEGASRLNGLGMELPADLSTWETDLASKDHVLLWFDLRKARPTHDLEALLAVAANLPDPPWVVFEGDDADPAHPTARLLVDRFPRLLLCRGESPCLVLGNASGLALPSRVGIPRLTPGQGCLLALDVDGVLIDVGRSFHEAVARALRDLVPGIAWTDAHFDQFKRLGGFNNDFRLTAAAWVLAETGRLEDIWAGDAARWEGLESLIALREPMAQEQVQRHYAETKSLERAAISRTVLTQVPAVAAILTGRPPEELVMAEEVLGFRLPAVCDAAPHLRKPSPAGLLQLADTFRAGTVVFAGDTRDDAACLARARALRPEINWRFAAIGPERHRFSTSADLDSESLAELLPRLQSQSLWGPGAPS